MIDLGSPAPLRLSCDRCVFRDRPKHRGHCADCIVTHLAVNPSSRPTPADDTWVEVDTAEGTSTGWEVISEGEFTLDAEERRVVARLVAVGLLPSLKHREAS
jgi:hypothetical protein